MKTNSETKELIQSTFISLYEELEDLDSISITKLCKTAGIARSTFYNYYDSVFMILQDVEMSLLSELDEIDKRTDRNPLNQDYVVSPFSTLETLRFLDSYRAFFSALLKENRDEFFKEKVREHIDHHLQEMLLALPKTKHDPKFVINYIGGAMLHAILMWLEDPCNMSPEEMTEFMISSIEANLSKETDVDLQRK